MQDSNIPTKIPTIWGASATAPYINPIPVPSQIGIQNGRASFTDGFPPNTFIQQSAGGSAPFGADFNGILQLMSQWLQWYQAGAPIAYDATFQAEISGYPRGAIIQSAAVAGLLWISTADGNTSNPDSGGANWLPMGQPFAVDNGSGNVYSAPLGMTQRIPNLTVRVVLTHTNTAATSFNAGYGALPIKTLVGGNTPAGFLQANTIVSLIDTGGQWVCPSGGGLFAGDNNSWININYQGLIWQGGQGVDSVNTTGSVTFASFTNGRAFQNAILAWHIENVSSGAGDAELFMSSGITTVGTDLGHIKWWCTTANGATPHAPAAFRWEALGY